jgi:hypothetical protein
VSANKGNNHLHNPNKGGKNQCEMSEFNNHGVIIGQMRRAASETAITKQGETSRLRLVLLPFHKRRI